MTRPVIIATRGSALALAQANLIKAACEKVAPGRPVDLKIIKTTGDKLQTASLTRPAEQSTKGLFTKELEVALLANEADLAVHSLKDLPTDLPAGLRLAATPLREDVRDVLIVRADANLDSARPLQTFAAHATIATSSSRRAAQIQAIRSDLRISPIRGNVGTRIKKLLAQPELAGTVLAAAGLNRLRFEIAPDGTLSGQDVPDGIKAYYLPLAEMLPAVGQAAIGLEIRENDAEIAQLCAQLNHPETFSCVAAERSFLRAMGGGCLSPIAAHATILGDELHLQAVSLKATGLVRGEIHGPPTAAEELGQTLARRF